MQHKKLLGPSACAWITGYSESLSWRTASRAHTPGRSPCLRSATYPPRVLPISSSSWDPVAQASCTLNLTDKTAQKLSMPAGGGVVVARAVGGSVWGAVGSPAGPSGPITAVSARKFH